jgi:hypothetical protein
MCFADIINFNNGGKKIAYSNGSAIANNTSPSMTLSDKAHFEYIGLHLQRYIDKNEVGFKSTINIRNRYEVISILLPTNYLKKRDSTLKIDTYFFNILGTHSFQKIIPSQCRHKSTLATMGKFIWSTLSIILFVLLTS